MQHRADLGEGDDEDGSLLIRIAEGDHAAFRSLVERHLDRMMSLASRLIGDHTLAERLVEDAMLEIWKIGAGWTGHHEPIRHWLYRRIVRSSLNLASIVASKPAAEDGDLDVEEIIAQFPPVQRAALTLSLGELLPTAQIAEILQIDEEAVEALVKTGRRHMRRALRVGSDKGYA